MILHRMTATFGRLNGDSLTLHEGLNVLTAPNEAGKSTWAAFLLSMLYGVDTAERATRTSLPVKTKYRPWSGRPMEGSLELTWEGRRMVIERTSQGRAPMAQFRAYDAATGRPAELAAEACGPALLGVERSVYERSGFIRQQGMALTADHALEARLEALVTTGDEACSCSRAEQRLRELRNRRRHNRTGLLPQAEAQLAAVQARLDGLRQLGRESMALEARREALDAELQALERRAGERRAQEARQRQLQLEQALQDRDKKEAALEEKRRTVEGLPAAGALQELLLELERLAETGSALESDLRLGVPEPELPDCPPAFTALTAEQVRSRAEEDCRQLSLLQRRRIPWLLPALLALAGGGLAVGMAGLLSSRPLPAAAGLLLAAAAGAAAVVHGLRRRRAGREAREILERYGAGSAADVRRMAEHRCEALLFHQRSTAAAENQRRALSGRSSAFAARREALLAQIRPFAPGVQDLDAARSAVRRGIHLWQFHAAAQREAALACERYEALRSAMGPPAAGGAAGADDGRLDAVRRELQDVQSQLDLRRGRMEASGDPAALAAEQEQLTERIARLQREYDALTLALDALGRANDSLQTRFSPRINELAARYISRLTGGRYDRVLLDPAMHITARQAGEAVTRPLPALSAGTADQLYLAVRLAIAALALPPQAPLVLDDALIAFDDTRMAAAMELLQELSRERQILLFTCQGREAAWLERCGGQARQPIPPGR